MAPATEVSGELDDRYYTISEVSKLANIPNHVLRQWEERFPALRPKRSSTNRRQYTARDIALIRRIIQLHRHEKRTTEGVRRQLRMELEGLGRPDTKQEVIDRIDRIAAEARSLLALLDQE
jgi:DNA-binding transcriptional MerR regulator